VETGSQPVHARIEGSAAEESGVEAVLGGGPSGTDRISPRYWRGDERIGKVTGTEWEILVKRNDRKGHGSPNGAGIDSKKKKLGREIKGRALRKSASEIIRLEIHQGTK